MTRPDIDAAESSLGVKFPAELRALYAERDGRFHDPGQWWVVWPLARLIEDNRRAWADGMLPKTLLAFGDDGTGNPFCIALDDDRDEVLRWSWIDGEVEQSAGTMAEFLREWMER